MENLKVKTLFQQETEEREALQEGFKTVLENSDFSLIARKLFDLCKHLIGAKAGYVALLSEDGSENELLFLDSGGLSCTADTRLPMPVRGLRSIAYQSNKAVYENDFMHSKWAKFMPEGHVVLKNVMFAPLVIGNKTVGIIGIANKEDDFTEKDIEIASSFGELAAIAFKNTRELEKRLKAEAALEKSREKYRTLFEYNPVETIVVDSEAKILMYNRAKEHSGVRLPEIGDIMYKDYAGRHKINMYKELIDCMKSGNKKEFTDMEYDDQFYNIRISPFSDGAIITSLDMTESKILREQLHQAQKMEGIGTLAGGIAHDFNNILSPIMIHSDFIMEDLPSDDALQNDIKEIYKAANRAKRLVNQILTIARKKANERVVLKVPPIIKESVKFLRSTIPTTIDIQYFNRAEQDNVLADPTQINQIVMNLCTNAAHAMKENCGLLEVTLENRNIPKKRKNGFKSLKPGKYLKLSVKDTGTGIDPDIIDNIFDPYYTTKEVGEGTGLGLSIIHGIIKDCNGDIHVDSAVGKGTTFHVYLPVVEIEAPTQDELTKKDIPKGNETILMVDDNTPQLNAAKKMLERLGYKVTDRTSSVEAPETFRNNPDGFDLIVTDMTMPEMTGDNLAREVMKIRPDIPVILCTGFSDKIDKEKAEKIGIKSFIMKPVERNIIAKAIRNTLDTKV